VDTHFESVVFMHKDCPVCHSEGFSAQSRILLSTESRQTIATLYQVTTDMLGLHEAALSDSAWKRLGLIEGGSVIATHPDPLESLGHVRSRIHGHDLEPPAFKAIIRDIVAGRYSDIDMAAFITACASRPLNYEEVLGLTQAMVESGERLSWTNAIVLDKHCVGGLPGNRTTPIVVAIVASLGLTMPKTSSRAITSPSGTADSMETLAPVRLGASAIRRVVAQEGGCIVWGGGVDISPADDILIRIERAIDIDSEGQMVASVLSKKIAAGSTHVVLDLPVGPTAKVRSPEAAVALSDSLSRIAAEFELQARVVLSDGSQPVGKGIGPALEARDVLAVLQSSPQAPADLRDRAVTIAGELIELAGLATQGAGRPKAAQALADGSAWDKFQRICEAQGGMRTPPVAAHSRPLLASKPGFVEVIDNRRVSKLAKLAGAPDDKAAGVEVHVRLDEEVVTGQPLCTIHAEAPGALAYALEYAAKNRDMFTVRG
jgi:thymidine phosphorylase